MQDGEVSITRRILWGLASTLSGVVLTVLAWLLGFFDNPAHFDLVMSIIFALWMVTFLVLYVVITKVGQAPDRDE